MHDVGEVQELWRYPVKSIRGERLAEASVGERGLLGDRALALIDRETGGVVSAKQPRKWRRLLECSARLDRPAEADMPPLVSVTFPDGREIRSDEAGFDATLSEFLGRPVAAEATVPENARRETYRPAVPGLADEDRISDEPMARGAPGTFFDYAPLHLLTTATLDRLREMYPEGELDVPRFRPNLVIDAGPEAHGFIEQEWLGQTLVVGDVWLRVIDPTPRCVIPTLAQPDLPADFGILRMLAEHTAQPSATLRPGATLRAVAGVYASVLRPGLVRPGDRVRLIQGSPDQASISPT